MDWVIGWRVSCLWVFEPQHAQFSYALPVAEEHVSYSHVILDKHTDGVLVALVASRRASVERAPQVQPRLSRRMAAEKQLGTSSRANRESPAFTGPMLHRRVRVSPKTLGFRLTNSPLCEWPFLRQSWRAGELELERAEEGQLRQRASRLDGHDAVDGLAEDGC